MRIFVLCPLLLISASIFAKPYHLVNQTSSYIDIEYVPCISTTIRGSSITSSITCDKNKQQIEIPPNSYADIDIPLSEEDKGEPGEYKFYIKSFLSVSKRNGNFKPLNLMSVAERKKNVHKTPESHHVKQLGVLL